MNYEKELERAKRDFQASFNELDDEGKKEFLLVLIEQHERDRDEFIKKSRYLKIQGLTLLGLTVLMLSSAVLDRWYDYAWLNWMNGIGFIALSYIAWDGLLAMWRRRNYWLVGMLTAVIVWDIYQSASYFGWT